MDFEFERDCRTPTSESYAILDSENHIGRVDLHFTLAGIHATLCVPESFTQEDIQELIDTIDDELVDSMGIVNEEMVVHVFQGRDVGVFSDEGQDDSGNGRMGA